MTGVSWFEAAAYAEYAGISRCPHSIIGTPPPGLTTALVSSLSVISQERDRPLWVDTTV